MLKPNVFITYSHADRAFASKLATDLFQAGQNVWWDEWELKVGDSLLDKIGAGIQATSYLVALLSPDSVESPWVTKELNAALTREIAEKRVIVLPCLVRDCDIPTFLRDKFYADFRERYEQGFSQLLQRLEPFDLRTHGRREDPDRHYNDYAFEWGKLNGNHAFQLDIASHGPEATFSVVARFRWVANEGLSKRYDEFEAAGFEWGPPALALANLLELAEANGGRILISGDQEAHLDLDVIDTKRAMGMSGFVTARRLGPHEGDLLFEFASTIRAALEGHRKAVREAVGEKATKEWFKYVLEHPLK